LFDLNTLLEPKVMEKEDAPVKLTEVEIDEIGRRVKQKMQIAD